MIRITPTTSRPSTSITATTADPASRRAPSGRTGALVPQAGRAGRVRRDRCGAVALIVWGLASLISAPVVGYPDDVAHPDNPDVGTGAHDHRDDRSDDDRTDHHRDDDDDRADHHHRDHHHDRRPRRRPRRPPSRPPASARSTITETVTVPPPAADDDPHHLCARRRRHARSRRRLRCAGGAITVALCGHWDHEPPCPLAPHHTDAVPADDGTVRLRVLFASDDEARVRSLIGQALSSGRLTGPDGRVTTWTVRVQQPRAASVPTRPTTPRGWHSRASGRAPRNPRPSPRRCAPRPGRRGW